MNTVDTLRHLAAIADSRAEILPLGDERSDYQWFSNNAGSLANAIERGVLTDARISAEVAKLNEICDLTV